MSKESTSETRKVLWVRRVLPISGIGLALDVGESTLTRGRNSETNQLSAS